MRTIKSALSPLIHALGRAAVWAIAIISITSYAYAIALPEAPAAPRAPIMATKIFTQSDKSGVPRHSRYEFVDFEVPKAGKAILRVVNGAKIGATERDRLAHIDVSLNGQDVVTKQTFNKTVNVLEVGVSLQQGTNRLGVMLLGKKGHRLSARIDAPPDAIHLKPVPDPLAIGESLQAEAMLTGLGRPVHNGQIEFSVSGLGDVAQRMASTDTTGVARTTLTSFQTAGTGILKATVVGSQTTLVDEMPIKVLAGPRSLVLEQRPRLLRLEVGSDALVAFTIDVRSVEGDKDHITLESVVEPEDDGLTVVPGFREGGFDVSAPRRVPLNSKVVAEKPGSYTVATVATIADTGETRRVVLPVEVVEPGTPGPLLLGIPMASPSGVEPETSTPVIFRAQVDGTSTPPDVLFLDELDLKGEPPKLAVAELRDDGKGTDTEAGDRIYSGTHEIYRQAPAELSFRVRAVYFGEEVTSGATAFLVTPFPLQARPSDPLLLVPVQPGSPSRVFSNEVEIKVIPGVSPEEVLEIATSIGGTVEGVIPPLRIYLLEFPGDDSANGVMEAITAVSKFSQVEIAAPNFEMVYNTIDFNFGTDCDPNAAGCPDDGRHVDDDGNIIDHWYLTTIRARQAWEIAEGGSSDDKVAVIDNGVDCNHPDLNGRCTASGSGEHATEVAGVIAANANTNEGIAGIAWNTQLESIALGTDPTTTDAFKLKAALTTATDAKILNVSVKGLLDKTKLSESAQIDLMREGVCSAVNAGKLIVVAGGNISAESDKDLTYPAKLNEETSYPCPSPENRIMVNQLLAVGGSDKDDKRATWGTNKKSNDASYLDLYAPGVDIFTLTPITDENLKGETTKDGTTLSAAMVSGAAAVLWAYGDFVGPEETRAQAVHDRLIDTGDNVSDTWFDNNPCLAPDSQGCKRLNIEAAVNVPTVSGSVAGFDPTADVTLTAILGPQRSWAQTFRPSSSTVVSRVSLVLVADTNPPPEELGDLTIQIRTTTDLGLPSDTLLGAVTVPGATIISNNHLFDSTFTEYTLSSPVSLTAGQLYAIVATTDSTVVDSPFGPYKWSGQNSTNPYADGNSFVLDNTPDSAMPGVWDDNGGADDLGFRVIAGP